MKHIFNSLRNIEKQFSDKNIILFLDYDGTLTPISDTPEKAVLPKYTRHVLNRLKQHPRCKIAIISGRALQDVKKVVGIKGIIYAGNHGLEISGIEGVDSPFATRNDINLIRNIEKILQEKISGISGVFIENKRLTLSVHYRLADKKDTAKIKKLFWKSIKSFLSERKIKVTSGKMVFEIRPLSKWNKGKIVLWVLDKLNNSIKNKILPVYIGDDVTDEDAFRALKRKGLTVFVGTRKKTEALYNINSTDEVGKFLNFILLFLTERKNA